MNYGMKLGISNQAYHADRTAVSSTWLKIIDSHTPFHLRSYLDSPPAEPTEALAMGSAVDCLVFEPEVFDQQFIVAPDSINRRTNAGREEWAALQADPRTLLSSQQMTEALDTARAIKTHPVMVELMKSGVAQPVFTWKDPITGLNCKCKADWYDEASGTLFDLKTARDASPDEFAKQIANFRYHVQAAFYTDGVLACGKPVKRFVFGVMEKPDNRHVFTADHKLMAFYELPEEEIEAGRDAYTSALAAINFCMTHNEWAGYNHTITPLTRPAWSRNKDMPTTL